MTYRPVGTIHSPFKDIKGMPIQPTGALGIAGTVEIESSYADGLKDIEGFFHIMIYIGMDISSKSFVVHGIDEKKRVLVSGR